MPESMPDQTVEPSEPWMRNTHRDLDALRRGVVHALELAALDAEKWVRPLTTSQTFARPSGLPSVAFHMRHIARSLDRLLTYAEGNSLDAVQLEALSSEHDTTDISEVWREFSDGLGRATTRIVAILPASYEEPRGIGRRRLPTTVGGLLVHCAEHTQRHAGQMVTTAKVACF